MKFFLVLLICFPLLLKADGKAFPVLTSIDKFVRYNFDLKVDGKVPTTQVTFRIRSSGNPEVPCDTQSISPAVIPIADTPRGTTFMIYLNLEGESSEDQPNPTNCVLTKPMELNSSWLGTGASSGHVSFVVPERIRLEIDSIKVVR